MTNFVFSEIERMHAEWSKMDNFAKIAWLTKERRRLDELTSLMAQHVSANGGLMSDSERSYARKLLDMINSVDAEGSKVMDELRNDAFKEIIKSIMKQ